MQNFSKNHLVSILLPTYNRGSTINKCIESIINQTYLNWELIILDDCSTDDTQNIIEYYVNLSRKIKYYKNKTHKGLPGTRNIGLALSKGDLIFFVEDDLELDRECLSILVETYSRLSKNFPVGGIAPRLISDNDAGKSGKIEPFIFNRYTGEIENNYSINLDNVVETITLHACSLYERKKLLEIGGYGSDIFIGNYFREETDLNWRLRKKGYHLFFQSKAIAFHRRYDFGGCRHKSLLKSEYFTIRNHLMFLKRNFGLKFFYMCPIFLGSRPLKYFHNFLKRTFQKTINLFSRSRKN
ncbi:MAG TPA: glycosyltransferase family 2 protein [Methanolinea sp.]|nr:glycosyltransferase family 2 protein [Methanolinea sp.]